MVTSTERTDLDKDPSRIVKKGDQIIVGGGYDYDSPLRRSEISGTVVDFIPGYQPGTLAAVVQLDAPITHEGITGDILVLELRYEGASWDREDQPGSQTVGVALYSYIPKVSDEYPQKGWVVFDSHGIFEVVGEG